MGERRNLLKGLASLGSGRRRHRVIVLSANFPLQALDLILVVHIGLDDLGRLLRGSGALARSSLLWGGGTTGRNTRGGILETSSISVLAKALNMLTREVSVTTHDRCERCRK